MSLDAEATLKRLADQDAIRRLIYLYCRGLDRLDEATLASIYHDDAIEDRGEGVFIGPARDMVQSAIGQLRTAFAGSQHFIGNVIIDIDGDVAFGESYFHAYHRYLDQPGREPKEMIMAGRYLDRFERRDGVWKIARRKMVMDWARTQPRHERWIESHPGAYRSRGEIGDSRLDS